MILRKPSVPYNFPVRSVTLAQALASLLDERSKTAQIKTNPRVFFVHVRVPDHVAEQLRDVQRRVVPDEGKQQDIDHVTLVYTKKPLEDHPPEKVHEALDALRRIGERTEPIEAKIQGWGYFDGAERDGKTTTALVALLDAPGLEHLHVDMSRALKDIGIEPSGNHVFTPHITLGYLGAAGRAEQHLEPLTGRFTIDKAHVASRDVHEIPLAGDSVGRKAAAEAMAQRELERGIGEEMGERHLPLELTEKLVRDHLEREPDYYAKAEKEESIGRKAAEFATGKLSSKTNFSMSTSALRQDHREAPGKGETSATVGTATPQTGAMHSGGGFK